MSYTVCKQLRRFPTDDEYWGAVLLLGDARGVSGERPAGAGLSEWDRYLHRVEQWLVHECRLSFCQSHFCHFLRTNDLMFSEEEKAEMQATICRRV